MNLINIHAYNHIWPRTPEPDTTIWTCTRCGHSETFYATQLTAGNGLTDLLTWATHHTGSDCIPEPPPRPTIPDPQTGGTATADEIRYDLSELTARPRHGGGNLGHTYDHLARCKNELPNGTRCSIPFEKATHPCEGTTT